MIWLIHCNGLYEVGKDDAIEGKDFICSDHVIEATSVRCVVLRESLHMTLRIRLIAVALVVFRQKQHKIMVTSRSAIYRAVAEWRSGSVLGP